MTQPSPIVFAALTLAAAAASGCTGSSGGGLESVTDGASNTLESTDSSSSGGSTSSADSSSETEASGTSTSDATTDATTDDSTDTSTDTSDDGGVKFDLATLPDTNMGGEELPDPTLWYTAGNFLFYIGIDPADGSVSALVQHDIVADAMLPTVGGGLALLDDGGLLLVRGPSAGPGGNYAADSSSLYYAPPDTLPTTIAGVAEFQFLGKLPDNTAVEALHLGCEGEVYLMDSGTNSASITGNRLLRFTGDYLSGDLSYDVITDLGMAQVSDIDDMSPGIDIMGEITDSQGFGMDSGTVYSLNYLDGTGVALGMVGTYGIYALGGAFFDDDVARLYVMDGNAALFEVDPVTLVPSAPLVIGPVVPGVAWKANPGLAGPLSACDTGFPPA